MNKYLGYTIEIIKDRIIINAPGRGIIYSRTCKADDKEFWARRFIQKDLRRQKKLQEETENCINLFTAAPRNDTVEKKSYFDQVMELNKEKRDRLKRDRTRDNKSVLRTIKK